MANQILQHLNSHLPDAWEVKSKVWLVKWVRRGSLYYMRKLREAHPRSECWYLAREDEVVKIIPRFTMKGLWVPEEWQGPHYRMYFGEVWYDDTLVQGPAANGYRLMDHWVALINASECWIEAAATTKDPTFTGQEIRQECEEVAIYVERAMHSLPNKDVVLLKVFGDLWRRSEKISASMGADGILGNYPKDKLLFE